MTAFYLYDDARARQFEPFAMTRPMGELRVGARLMRERWERVLGLRCAGFISRETLADFDEDGAPDAATGVLPTGSYLVNARYAPALTPAPAGAAYRGGDALAAIRLPRDLPVSELADGTLALESFGAADAVPLEGWWIREVWDLLAELETRLRDDLARLTAGRDRVAPANCQVLGDGGVFAAPDAVIEPYVTFDCTNGPVVLEAGATIQSFTRVQGPTWIGPHATVGGDKIIVCAIGEACKVHGEMNSVVMIGHANKAHDGFVGHSYLGRWVNLGANTVTSNLKNTYGPVALWTPDGIRNTGLQFLGTMFGDHAKTGIGLTLTTGCVIGAGAQLYGSQMPPKAVSPFSWGDAAPYETYAIDKFLQVAERMMARRHVALTERGRAFLRRAFDSRWSVES